jgi:hypothetical protein
VKDSSGEEFGTKWSVSGMRAADMGVSEEGFVPGKGRGLTNGLRMRGCDDALCMSPCFGAC